MNNNQSHKSVSTIRKFLIIAGVFLGLLLLLSISFALEDRCGITSDDYLPALVFFGTLHLVHFLGAYLGCRLTRTKIRSIWRLIGYSAAATGVGVAGGFACGLVVDLAWQSGVSFGEITVWIALVTIYLLSALFFGHVILRVKAKDFLLFLSGLVWTHVGAVGVLLVIVVANIAGKDCR